MKNPFAGFGVKSILLTCPNCGDSALHRDYKDHWYLCMKCMWCGTPEFWTKEGREKYLESKKNLPQGRDLQGK